MAAAVAAGGAGGSDAWDGYCADYEGSLLVCGRCLTGKSMILHEIARCNAGRYNEVYAFSSVEVTRRELGEALPTAHVAEYDEAKVHEVVETADQNTLVILDDWVDRRGRVPRGGADLFATCSNYAQLRRVDRDLFDVLVTAKETERSLLRVMRGERDPEASLPDFEARMAALPRYTFLAFRHSGVQTIRTARSFAVEH